MDRSMDFVVPIVAICIGLIIGLGLFSPEISSVHAQLKTGNLAQEVRRIASQDTDRFLGALEDTTNDFPWQPGQKAAWWSLFKTNLGLGGYTSNTTNVKLWERVRATLKTKYDANEVDTLLDTAISELTPLEGISK